MSSPSSTTNNQTNFSVTGGVGDASNKNSGNGKEND